ncbi:hypothetical protein PENTCL1PPCAC_22860 [Pristionchus entomophagus]|uniref:Uncharacterized protein n=1 Tax=Pristionchus entomophagus TaxID=358040 RepID=A0AAV5U1E8_9BILA|nr:hypothetical protein PENTCL1PPCAC_22860 [Pristionchus entomophagus]
MSFEMADDAFDEALHDELLSAITSGKLKNKPAKKSIEDIGAGELLNAIKSTKNVKESRDSISSKKKKKTKESGGIAHKTLQAPLHRSEVEKIQRRIGFDELEKDLKVWEPVVSEHVHANNQHFPLNRETFNIQTAASRNEGFVARTPLEKAMDAVLATSKCNLGNNQEYTQEEMEIIKAMNVAEAKEKLSKLRRLRALQSYQEAKFRRQGKIKSKNYHRIMKRAKRREELKELDELLVRDPEAARAKLEELDKDRIYERATLKHRSQNKMSKVLARHASKDPNAKKLMDDHIRFGKEMKEKVGLESEEDGSDDEKEEGRETEDLLKDVLKDVEETEMDEESARKEMKKMRMDKQRRAREEKARGEGIKIELVELVPFDEYTKEEEEKMEGKKRKNIEDGKMENEASKNKKKKMMSNEEKETVPMNVHFDVDQVFDEIEMKVNRDGKSIKEKRVKKGAKKEIDKAKSKKDMKNNAEKKKGDENDLILDPNNYLISETSKLMQMGPDMDDGNDLIEDRDAKMGEAFVDDDVMAEFVDEKEEIEEAEKEKDMDLTLLGWGSWTGPGMSNNKKKKFVIKAQEKVRKDKGKVGLIISEKRDTSMDALQPKNVPFPFSRMEDYEASLSQPLGKEWNSLSSHSNLIKPTVSTQGGRVILPMSKKVVLKTRMEKAEER